MSIKFFSLYLFSTLFRYNWQNVYQVLLEYSHVDLFMCCLCLFCTAVAGWDVGCTITRPTKPKLKYLPSGPLQKNFAHPVRKLHSLNRNDHKPVWWKTAFPICLFALNYRKKWDPTKAQDGGGTRRSVVWLPEREALSNVDRITLSLGSFLYADSLVWMILACDRTQTNWVITMTFGYGRITKRLSVY